MTTTEDTLDRGQSAQQTVAVFAIGLALALIGSSMFNVLPLLAAGAADNLGFSARQVGVMSLALTTASGVSALLAGLWVRSVPWPQAAAVALGGFIAGNALAMVVHGFWAFALIEAAAGFFGSAAFSLGMTILSDRHESARTFGVAIVTQVAYQVVALLAGPSLLRVAGFDGVLLMLVVPAGLVMFLTPGLPARGRALLSEGAARGLLKPATLIAFGGFFLFFLNAGGYWTYLELMGEAQGMTSRVVANAASAGVAAGIPAGILALALGAWLGSLRPIALAALLTLVAAFLLRGSFSVLEFVVAGALYYFAWNYSVAYQLALVNEVDPTGRAVAVTGACAYFGSAAGAGLAAFFVGPGHYHAVIWLVAVAVTLSTALYLLAAAIYRDSAQPLRA